MSQIPLFHIVPTVISFLFLITALVFVCTRRSDGSSAKTFAILGLCILLGLRVATLIVNAAIALYTPDDFMLYHGLYSIASSIFYMLGLGLLIAAVFTRRHAPAESTPNDMRMPVASGNPYVPPVNG